MLNKKNELNNTRKKSKSQEETNINMACLWNLFDEEFDKKKPIECLYDNNEISDNKCNICKTMLIIDDNGFNICPNNKCGIIYKNSLDSSPEWRFFGSDDNQGSDPTRCGMPINPLLMSSSYSCKVINTGSSYEMQKIRRYTEWQSMPYREKSNYDEFTHINIISNNAGIPKMITEDAMRFYKQISEAKTFRGLNRDSIIAASIYISSKVNNYPRSAKEIAEIFNLDNTSATKGCKNAVLIINDIEHNNNNDDNLTKLAKITPLSFLERYCSKLSINDELTKLCKFIANQVEKNRILYDNTPSSIAGGIIYFVSQNCNINISKYNINNVSKISEVTINKCYKKLEEHRDKLLPNSILSKYN